MLVLKNKYFTKDKKFDNFPRRLRKKYLRKEQEAIEDDKFNHEFLKDRYRRKLKDVEGEFEATRIVNRNTGYEVPEANYDPLFHNKEFYIPEDKKAELASRKKELLKEFKTGSEELDRDHKQNLEILKKRLIARDREQQIDQDRRRRNNEHLVALDALKDRAKDLRKLKQQKKRKIIAGTVAGTALLTAGGLAADRHYKNKKKKKDDNTKKQSI